MPQVIFHPDAENELNAAADYYEKFKNGLGISFLHEIEKGLELIKEQPFAWGIMFEDIRRLIIHRFPYSIIYREDDDLIIILAIAHLHRKPNYWKDRK